MLATSRAALAKAVVFVPADDRPVSLAYVVDTLQAANIQAITPPANLLANRTRPGQPDALWHWLEQHGHDADAFVLSADTLIYGGLVPSRTHDLPTAVLQTRLRQFAKIKEINPNARLYVFATVMRTPQYSLGGVEPPYYDAYGHEIFLITALEDKKELDGLSPAEQQRLQMLHNAVPDQALQDWLTRRAKNFRINEQLIEDVKNGLFNYLLLGRDDTAPYSQTHREGRMLAKEAADLGPDRFATFPGADQLGMLLVTRAVNDLTFHIPSVAVEYAAGNGSLTIPSYEDQPFGDTVQAHIMAAGAIPLLTPSLADMVLVVNTPPNGITKEAENPANLPVASPAARVLADKIQAYVNAGKPVMLADVAFANGADNGLLHELAVRGLLPKLAAYSGWNTASNTLGYTIGQGILSRLTPDAARQHLLAVRYLDDWAYQANIRRQIRDCYFYGDDASAAYLDALQNCVTRTTEQKIRRFAAANLRDMGFAPDDVSVSFPWNRLFEIKVDITPGQHHPQPENVICPDSLTSQQETTAAFVSSKKTK